MGLSDAPSLQHAKWVKFYSLCTRCKFTFPAKLCQSKSLLKRELRVVLCKYNPTLATSAHTVALKYEDTNNRLHYFRPSLEPSFFSEVESSKNGIYYMEHLPRKWSSTIFDQMCEISDRGCRLVLVTYEPKTKQKTTTVFMEPYEGTKLLIEADFIAPDYASLDWERRLANDINIEALFRSV